ARHPLYHRPDDSISDEEFAACAAAHPGVDVNRAGIEQLQSLNLSARAYQFDTRTPLILSGCYLGFFPMSYIQGFIERKEVRLLQPEKRRYKVNHVFVHRQERTLDTKIELFYQAQRAVGLHTE
ncbi:MAG: LysR family transcriptional regulator, partial [Gammaproteobacteria bacterium]